MRVIANVDGFRKSLDGMFDDLTDSELTQVIDIADHAAAEAIEAIKRVVATVPDMRVQSAMLIIAGEVTSGTIGISNRDNTIIREMVSDVVKEKGVDYNQAFAAHLRVLDEIELAGGNVAPGDTCDCPACELRRHFNGPNPERDATVAAAKAAGKPSLH